MNAGYPYKIIEAVKDLGTRNIVYLNEAQVRNVTSPAGELGAFPAGSNYSIGSKFNLPFNGEIAEIIIYKSALDSVNRRKVENYLYEKYAPPVTLGPDITVNYGFCPVKLTGATACFAGMEHWSNCRYNIGYSQWHILGNGYGCIWTC